MLARMSRPTDTRPRRPAPVDLDAREGGPLAPAGAAAAPVETSYDAVSSWFGSLQRSGSWPAADRIDARARFGDVKLDFCGAELPPDGMVEIHCDALFGQVELIVPAGADVETDGVRVWFGELRHGRAQRRIGRLVRRMLTGEEDEESPDLADEDRPLFVVTGRALFGAIHVIHR
jgi:predicted membrane protein